MNHNFESLSKTCTATYNSEIEMDVPEFFRTNFNGLCLSSTHDMSPCMSNSVRALKYVRQAHFYNNQQCLTFLLPLQDNFQNVVIRFQLILSGKV